MPFRPGISSQGEDYVGELEGLSRKLMQSKGTKFPYLYKFESEDELSQVEHDLVKQDETDTALFSARRRYMAYWGAVKRELMQGHQDHYDQCIPTKRREWACGLCRCNNSTFKCMCDSGKKMLSPTRIVFWNSRIAWQTRNQVYDINLGMYVPKAKVDQAPDWRQLSWEV